MKNIFFITLLISLIQGVLFAKLQPINVKCEKHGLDLSIAPNIRQIKVCASPFCFDLPSPSSHEFVEFPKMLLIYTQNIIISYWVDTDPTEEKISITCAARSFCELIECYLCQEFLLNPSCYPWQALVLLAVLSYSLIALVYTTFKMILAFLGLFIDLGVIAARLSFYVLFFLSLFPWALIQLFHSITCNRFKKRYRLQSGLPSDEEDLAEVIYHPPRRVPMEQQPRNRNSIRQLAMLLREFHAVTLIISLIALFSAAPTAHCTDCSEVATFTTDTNTCIRNGPQLECKISASIILTIPPHGQSACFLIKDSQELPIGTMELKFKEILFRCKPMVHHLTRDYSLKHFDVKVCAHEGSCKGTRCADLKPNDPLPELEIVAERPGYNYCVESCGFWSCGCPLPTAGCLFHRIFAEETSDKQVHEVFKCPYWSPIAPLDVILTTNNVTKNFSLDLSPGITWTSSTSALQVTLTSPFTPHASLLDSYFITNGTSTALLEDLLFENSKILTCPDLVHAMDCLCRFSPSACRCLPAEVRMNCVCEKPLFQEAYSKTPLPLVIPAITFREIKGDIEASFSEHTSLQVQIRLQNFLLINTIDITTCTMNSISNAPLIMREP